MSFLNKKKRKRFLEREFVLRERFRERPFRERERVISRERQAVSRERTAVETSNTSNSIPPPNLTASQPLRDVLFSSAVEASCIATHPPVTALERTMEQCKRATCPSCFKRNVPPAEFEIFSC